MKEVFVDTTARCCGQPALVVESKTWRMVVLPTLGGKIWELEYRPKAFQFLWHNPNLVPRPVELGAAYDEVWSGGWDDIFPTDAPYMHRGERFPDHGEFWSIEWQYEVLREGDGVVLHLWSVGPVTRARFDKWIRVPAADSTLRFRYRIVNPGAALPFLFKLHPALQVNEHSRIVLPRCRFRPDSEYSTWFPAPTPAFAWPNGQKSDGSSVDLRTVWPAGARATLFGCATELEDGFCGMIYPDKKVAFGLAFPREQLPCCWIFASYGGFLGHQVVVLEPCTTDHWRLGQCVESGSAPNLTTGKDFDVNVNVVAVETDQEDALSQKLQSVCACDAGGG